LYTDRYQDILHSINLARKGNPGLRSCDGHQELLKYLRSDVIEVASRLQKGGLGYMDDSMDEFERKVAIYSHNQLTCLESGVYPDHISGQVIWAGKTNGHTYYSVSTNFSRFSSMPIYLYLSLGLAHPEEYDL
jgi:hypothetical protein